MNYRQILSDTLLFVSGGAGFAAVHLWDEGYLPGAWLVAGGSLVCNVLARAVRHPD